MKERGEDKGSAWEKKHRHLIEGKTQKDWVVITTTPRDDQCFDAEYVIFKNGREVSRAKDERVFYSSATAVEVIKNMLEDRKKSES
jgi:hypothetical protein